MNHMVRGLILALLPALFFACKQQPAAPGGKQQHHRDVPFRQDYSIRYYTESEQLKLNSVASDRNGYIQLFGSDGLMRLRAGEFLFPGTIVKDQHDKPTSDKKIAALGLYQNQFVYLDDKAVFSNAWAGNLYSRHSMPDASVFAGGSDFTFLISNGKRLVLLKDSEVLWEGELPSDAVRQIRYDEAGKVFWIRGDQSIFRFTPGAGQLESVISGTPVTAFALSGNHLIAGTADGYFRVDTQTGQRVGDPVKTLPWTEITSVEVIDGSVWMGTTRGAFRIREDGKNDYYAGERWLPSDDVTSITGGPDRSVLVLTGKGVGRIFFREMTLHDKAMFFDKQVRERHIRTGFNATLGWMTNGDVTTGTLENSDNDGLWTAMYVAGEALRYSVTRSEEALQNVRESLDAMERLYTINPMKSGFPSRSFQRSGYNENDKPWRKADDPEWDWKSTTSSDEAIGHIFAFGVIAELVDAPEVRSQAIMLIDTLMSHIISNDFYLIDWNGEPTLWGRWHPDYVNGFPTEVGDRKLNSSNIVGMLQTAYHFTGKEKFKKAAFYLMEEHGYLENLMRPMEQIGMAPEDKDDWAKMLSESWNHSDDEMYYCGYWGLYRYAFNDTLKAMYREAILDHWESERPEKEGLWNIMTALVGVEHFDLDEAVWYLQEYPLDLIDWSVSNSHRKDIVPVEHNFRRQTITEVLPPDELPVRRHNSNRFALDANGGGRSEFSAGDIWLLPYWMGRYLGVIGEPEK